MKTDILIVGSGCAGLYCALNLPADKKIAIITKADVKENDSFLAQGGMCMLRDASDFESFFGDTMRAGHYENDGKSVKIMIQSSTDVVKDLIAFGADFQKDENDKLVFTKEGAHSKSRIIFREDMTGKEITSTLLRTAKKKENITFLEHTTMIDIVEKDNVCYGVIAQMEDGSIEAIEADYTVMATGGIGGLYKHSTNFRHLTGDAIAIAINHGIELKDISYVQIHPTTLYTKEDRSFLISESVRGEGAVLRNKDGERFVNELLPRDVVSNAIYKQMEKDQTEFVWEDLRTIPEEELRNHFPNIVSHCLEMGYDVTKECIPVVPAQHYFMGGIKIDYEGRTSMNQLYAIGETACNGVHGKNRLASNSLLESLVFAKRAAQDMIESQNLVKQSQDFDKMVNIEKYRDVDGLKMQYHNIVRETIRKSMEKGGNSLCTIQ